MGLTQSQGYGKARYKVLIIKKVRPTSTKAMFQTSGLMYSRQYFLTLDSS